MTAHAAGVLAAVLILRRAPFSVQTTAGPLAAAAGAAAVFIVAQALSPERGPKEIQLAGAAQAKPAGHPGIIALPKTNPVAETTNLSISAAGPSTNSPAIATNTQVAATAEPAAEVLPQETKLMLVDGQFTLDLTKVPVSGPMNAPKKVAKLFDYTCHHCRELQHLMHDFRQKYSNELAIISLPLPLEDKCNPVVKRTPAAHLNACEYARLGLAVFHANPAKFDEYSDWIYKPEQPPPIERAREFAAELVGSTNLTQALQNPAVDEQIKTDVEMYLTTYRLSHSGNLPQLYFEHSASIGRIATRTQLEKIMAKNLGFPAPTE